MSAHPTPQFVGYHGTSSLNVADILADINPLSGSNYSGYAQLGDGFYTTSDTDAADIFAQNAVLQRGGVPVILTVYVDSFDALTGLEVEPDLWWNVPQHYLVDYDYLTAPISGMEWAEQIKLNPHTYGYINARPH